MKFEWKGVFPAITTPFTQDDNLDLDMFSKNIRAQIEAGVNGIVIGGSLGEASTLIPEEKSVLVKETLKISNGRIPVVMNISEQSTKQAVHSAAKAKEDGADGLMLLPPMKYKATDYETVEYFKAVAGSTDLPVMIYNNPVDYKIEVTPNMFEQLLDYENINAVKDSTRDISNVTRMINRFGSRFKILTGVDPLGMESLLMGADGWVAGLVCAFPRETVAVYRLVKAGRIDEALKINRWFLPLLELDISPQLVQNIKLAEAAAGIGTENVRLPRLPLKGKERERVQAIIDKAMKTRPELPDYLSITI
jgi:4-hydroxy-tetrahydrodipicolinate synthase